MAGCCGSCDRGGACEGGGAACGSKGSGEVHAGAHPIVAKAREITGSHPAYRAPSRASGDISQIRTETQAHGYTPTAAELDAMGLSLAEWNALGDTDRVEYARGAGAQTGTLYDTPEKRAVAAASASGDEEAFTAALERVPESERAALLREHLRSQGASEDAIRAGLFRLGEQGIRGLTDWLNRDLQRDLAQIHDRAATEQTRIREEQQTARAEIDAATRRYEADRRAAAGNNSAPPVTQPAQSNAALYIGVGVGLLGVLAALVMTSRKGGN